MAAEKEGSAALGWVKVNMSKTAYVKWIRDAVLLSAKGGAFVIGATNT
jgi:hypothetical protein